MAFIRTKTVKGIEYHFLVEGVREGDKVRQKVVGYLGHHKTVKAAVRYWSNQARKKDPATKRKAVKMLKKLKPYLKEK